MEASARGCSLQEMLVIVKEMLDSSIVIVDLDGLVLAKNVDTRDFKVQDPAWKTFIENGIAEAETIAQLVVMTEDGKAFQMMTGKPQYLLTMPPHSNRFAAAYLTADEEAAAVVFVWSRKERLPGIDLHLLETVVPHLEKTAEFRGNNALLQSNTSVLLKLLEETDVPEKAVGNFLKRTHLEPPYVLLSISHAVRKDRPVPIAVCRMLADLSPENIAVEFDLAAVALISNRSISQVIQELQAKMDLDSYYCGISMPFESIYNLPMAYRQAKFAREQAKTPGITRCDQVAYPYLIRLLQEQPMAMELVHPGIEILKNYDRRNKTALYDTLKCFLKNQCSHNQTARDLFIHRNTLMYRLERIRALTEIDFSNQEEREYLSLSLRLC